MGEIVGIEGGTRRSGLGNSRVGNSGEAAKIGNQRRVDNAKLEVLVEERLLVGEAGLHIVNAAGVSDVGAEAGVGERTLLGDGLLLEIGRAAIGEGILAGIVVEVIAAEVIVGGEDGGRADNAGVAGREVDGLNLCALVGRAYCETIGPDGDAGGVGGPLGGVLRVVGVGRLEPGARVSEVQADRVGRRDLVVDAVEEVLLVALVVDRVELRRIEEAASVHYVSGDEVADLLRAVGEIEAHVGRAEGSVGRVDLAVRLGIS